MTSLPESVPSRRYRGAPVILVDRSSLLTLGEAAQLMGRRKFAVAHDVGRGYLTPAAAFDSSGKNLIEGVTRGSVEEQVGWWQSASLRQRAWRVVRFFLYLL